MVVIDVAGDDGPMPTKPGEGSYDRHVLRGAVHELPPRWPESLRRERRPMILRYVPDAGSPTFLEDMDAVVGLALSHSGNPNPVMILIHEIGRVCPANRTQPNMSRVLNHNRHHDLTLVACGPRPQTIDPLVLQQADLVYIFELNNPNDRRRVAESIGWDPKELDTEVAALGAHEYLRADAREPKPEQPGDEDYRLVSFAALPEDVVNQVNRWKNGDRTAADEGSPNHPMGALT
jgi:hypothetical protein